MERSYADDSDNLGVPSTGWVEEDHHSFDFFSPDHEEVRRSAPKKLDDQHGYLGVSPYHENPQDFCYYGNQTYEKNYDNGSFHPDKRKPTCLKTLNEQDVGTCWLPLQGPLNTILQIISFFFTDNKIDVSNPSYGEYVGYLFSEATYAFFNLLVYRREEDGQMGVRLRRLNGDAFLTTKTFRALRDELIKENLVFEESDPWNPDIDDGGEFDSEDIDEIAPLSDDEEEEELLDFGILNLVDTIPMPLQHLDLKNDPGLIDYWMNDLLENEYLDQRLHTLLMMAHNSENTENLELMLSRDKERVFASIKKVMEEDSANLPMIRSCVRTLHNIICGKENVTISWDMVKMMCECLLTWSQSQETQPFSYARPVSNSSGIQTDLAVSLNKVVKTMPGGVPEEAKLSIEEIRAWLEDEGSFNLCHAEARDNLEMFVENAISCC